MSCFSHFWTSYWNVSGSLSICQSSASQVPLTPPAVSWAHQLFRFLFPRKWHLTIVMSDFQLAKKLPSVFSSLWSPPSLIRERITADPTPFIAEMSHMYMPFSQQRADGLFGVFLINDHTDICDNVTMTVMTSAIIPPKSLLSIVWNNNVGLIPVQTLMYMLLKQWLIILLKITMGIIIRGQEPPPGATVVGRDRQDELVWSTDGGVWEWTGWSGTLLSASWEVSTAV